MTTKLNIFNALPQHHSDDEESHENNKEKKGPRVRKTGKNVPATQGDAGAKKTGALRGVDARETNQKKIESDLDHPHQLDRHSGTGQSAYQKAEKKGGSGAHNWGSYKDDKKFREKADADNDEPETEAAAEEEDKTITLDDYFQKTGGSQAQQQKNEAKSKVSADQLLKDLGKATKFETRKERQINEHQETHSKKNIEDHNVVMNTEHASLLGFRTGFRTYEDKGPKKPFRKDRPEGEKREDGKEEEGQQKAAEGEEQVQDQNQPEAPAEDKPEGGRGGRGGYRGGYRGGQRGGDRDQGRGGDRDQGRGGDRDQGRGGDRDQGRGGDREQGRGGDREQRGGYRGGDRGARGGNRGGNVGGKGRQGESKGFNPEDESAFPTLG